MIPEIKVFLIAMSPILELRASIPVAINAYHLSVWSAYFFSVIGNLVSAIFILLFLEKVSSHLSRRSYYFNRFFAWLFERTRKRHQRKFELFKEFALVILVAIPLPLTGAWTGSICAFVFGVPIKKALPLIFAGIIISGFIVTLITMSVLVKM